MKVRGYEALFWLRYNQDTDLPAVQFASLKCGWLLSILEMDRDRRRSAHWP